MGLDRVPRQRLIPAALVAITVTSAHDLACVLTRVSGDESLSELVTQLELLKTSLPKDASGYCQWYETNRTQWFEQLRQVMIRHRNIGYDWQSTEAQRQQLQRYYNANKVLIDLMKIEGAISDASVRAEIEDSLLLPWEELQRRYLETYGNS